MSFSLMAHLLVEVKITFVEQSIEGYLEDVQILGQKQNSTRVAETFWRRPRDRRISNSTARKVVLLVARFQVF